MSSQKIICNKHIKLKKFKQYPKTTQKKVQSEMYLKKKKRKEKQTQREQIRLSSSFVGVCKFTRVDHLLQQLLRSPSPRQQRLLLLQRILLPPYLLRHTNEQMHAWHT